MIVVDGAERRSVPILEGLRMLTDHDFYIRQRLSILLVGTEGFSSNLRMSAFKALRSQISYAHALLPFTIEETFSYLRFHIERAGGDPKLFTDDACRRVFYATHGTPRLINQLAQCALIGAAESGREEIDGRYMEQTISPSFVCAGGEQ